jgi:magnesium transporter
MVRRVVLRESTVGFFNGMAIGLLSGSIAAAATGQLRIGVVIGIAAMGNMTIANLAGTSIPIILDKLGQDPALASNIFLTLVTDMVGFAGFLALASLML